MNKIRAEAINDIMSMGRLHYKITTPESGRVNFEYMPYQKI